MKTISPDESRRFVARILERLGAVPERARRWAELLTETSLLGYDSHGIRMLDRYIRFIQGGGMDPRAEPVVDMDEGGCLRLDGRGGLGHLVADRAVDLALERARGTGIACVTAMNSNHAGACGIFSRKAALNGFIGICSSVSRPGMAPWGGRQALIGLNPFAFAAPAGERAPFLLDIATSLTSMGRITAAADQNEAIPGDWALDREGQPTTDAKAAISGTLLPIGGYKGYGLAMALEILTALLGGGRFAHEVRSWIQQTEEPMGSSFLCIALHIETWRERAGFEAGLAAWLELITASPRRNDGEPIRYPGERAGARFEERTINGLPVTGAMERMFAALAEEFGLPPPALCER